MRLQDAPPPLPPARPRRSAPRLGRGAEPAREKARVERAWTSGDRPGGRSPTAVRTVVDLRCRARRPAPGPLSRKAGRSCEARDEEFPASGERLSKRRAAALSRRSALIDALISPVPPQRPLPRTARRIRRTEAEKTHEILTPAARIRAGIRLSRPRPNGSVLKRTPAVQPIPAMISDQPQEKKTTERLWVGERHRDQEVRRRR